MANNTYAKVYRTESRPKKDEEFAFISYTDEPNSFSVVSLKRLVDVDKFRKGHIQDKNKTHRIVVERTGTLAEMEQLAKEAEEVSAYKMNSDVVSDTEEWHKRKKSSQKKAHDLSNLFDKQFADLQPFELDEHLTYTTLTDSLLDELDKPVNCAPISSDKEGDIEEETSDEEKENNEFISEQSLTSPFLRKVASKAKKRSLSRTSRDVTRKQSRTDNVSSPVSNRENHQRGHSILSTLKELSQDVNQLRKQTASVTDLVNQQKKAMALILTNQKKMAKAMRTQKIPIVLFDETENQTTTRSDDTNSVVFEFDNGDKIDLLEIPSDSTSPNKFVLKAIERLFKEEQELIDLDPKLIDDDKKIKCIREAVQVKFGLTKEQLLTVWTPMLECIKSKRRNVKAKFRKNNNDLSNDVQNQ